MLLIQEECAVCMGNIEKSKMKFFQCCDLNVCLECIDAKWKESTSSLFKISECLQCPCCSHNLKSKDLENTYGSKKFEGILQKYMTKLEENAIKTNLNMGSSEEIEMFKQGKFDLMRCVNCEQYFLFEGGCYSIKCIFCQKNFCYLCKFVYEGKYEYMHFPNGPLENCLNMKN